MKLNIASMEEIGELARFTRKAQGLRQDDLGAMAGCSHKFVVDVEKGKPTIQAGLLLQLLEELGIEITLDLPGDVSERLREHLLSQAPDMLKPRHAKWLSQIAR